MPIDISQLPDLDFRLLQDRQELDLWFNKPSATSLQIAADWVSKFYVANVVAGLSPNGYSINGTSTLRGQFQVLTSREGKVITEYYTPVEGTGTFARKFVIDDNTPGRIGVGVVRDDGTLQYIGTTSEGRGVIVELRPNDMLAVRGITTTKEWTAYSVGPDASNLIRAGAVSFDAIVQPD